MKWVEVSTQAQLDALKAGESAIVRSGLVRAYGSATVHAYGSATVHAYDSATVRAYGSATVHAYDSATVHASGSATVRAYGSATVHAYDSATVHAYGSATVHASGSATVRASGSATVHAYDSATVHAYDSATVHASKYVAVHHLSQRATVKGGVVIQPKTDTPADWCDFYGVEVKRGMAVLYKAVEDDWMGTHKRGITYRPGDKPKAPDFSPVAECGGGLHLSPRPYMARDYCDDASHFVACKVRVADLVLLGDKVKVPGCTVLHEVNEHGEAL